MYKLLLTNFSFIIVSLAIIMVFITATSYAQLAVAIILYPLLVFFAYVVFLRKFRTYTSRKQETVTQHLESRNPASNMGIADTDKRTFLKLIGGAGLFLFLFSLFNKRPEGLFFKNFPGSLPTQNTTANQVGTNQNQLPLEGYVITEIDDNIISFYGFTNSNGGWYIMRMATETGTFRYAKGDSDFPSNWKNRENLKYDYFHNEFNNL